MDCQKNSSTLRSLSFPVSGGYPGATACPKKNGPGEASSLGPELVRYSVALERPYY